MSDPNQEVLARLNALASQRFKLDAEEEDLDSLQAAAQAKLDAEFTQKRAELKTRANSLDAEIDSLIVANRDDLILPTKQSFSVERAKFHLTKYKSSPQVLDAAAIMRVARQLGVVKQIALQPRQPWKFNQKMFFAWLARHGELRDRFEPHLGETEARETLQMEPNKGYTVQHGKHRISPRRVMINRS